MIQDRIKELKRVKASELLRHPLNYRKHPEKQKRLLSQLLSEIGYADALLAYETPHGLRLIDGHLRAETTPEQEVPVLILDVNEQEANKLLLTLDPLAGLAETDSDLLAELLAKTETTGELEVWLQENATPPIDKKERSAYAAEEWEGMPEFEQNGVTFFRTLTVYLKTEADFLDFCALIRQEISEKAKYIYHPKQERRDLAAKRWVSEAK